MASSMTASSSSLPKQRFGLIILGNSGVGKSFLANLFLQEEKFVHKASPTSVTTLTEHIEYKIDNITYVIFNIPGLIEAKQEQIDINKKEIDKAFQEEPNAVVIYVFGNQGGRIRNEDVIAYNALNDAYPFESKSLILVVNGIPIEREENYEGATILLLRDLIHFQENFQNFCFLNWINKRNNQEKCQLRDKLLNAVFNALPKTHIKKHDIQLDTDQIQNLKVQIEKMQLEFDRQKDKLTAAFKLSQQEHQRKMNEQQQRFELAIQAARANQIASDLISSKNPYLSLVTALLPVVISLASELLKDQAEREEN